TGWKILPIMSSQYQHLSANGQADLAPVPGKSHEPGRAAVHALRTPGQLLHEPRRKTQKRLVESPAQGASQDRAVGQHDYNAGNARELQHQVSDLGPIKLFIGQKEFLQRFVPFAANIVVLSVAETGRRFR